jgi:hypothetical protein
MIAPSAQRPSPTEQPMTEELESAVIVDDNAFIVELDESHVVVSGAIN